MRGNDPFRQVISISLLSLGPHCILLLTATNLLPIVLKS